jgi:ring-1,2-phenylacetyl-CoA epoxidase subunit PaaD
MTSFTHALESEVWKGLLEVSDPELPSISIVEMGMVNGVRVEDNHVSIECTPTFVGCPALKIIEKNIIDRISAIPGVASVDVQFVFEPRWTTDRISESGREKLRKFGILPPPRRAKDTWEIECPYCRSKNTTLDNLFGPTACRSIAYCRDCKNPFEAIKPI